METKRERLFQRVVDIGMKEEYSSTERKYLNVSNIAAILGVLFNILWISLAISISDVTSAIWNLVLSASFSMVLILNYRGRRIFASAWLIVSAILSVFVFLYLSGYDSGITTVCFLIIIMPYMTFPKRARSAANAFSVFACVVLIVTVVFQSEFYTRNNEMDLYLSQIVNVGMTAFISLALIWSLSVLVDRSEDLLIEERKKSDDLLHNILPANVIKDLKESGETVPRRHQHVSVLFTDFEGFTELVASISAITLVNELNDIFGAFDDIMEENNVEKIETIGDAYMAASGLEDGAMNHAVNCVLAAKKMQYYLEERNRSHELKWRMRVGIHTGTVVAGVVGKRKFAYDLFGDTINTASRIETAGESGKINISSSTFELVKKEFTCISRGKIFAKGKGDLEMYFVQ